ncbi:MAG: LysR family transcriptional regulator [Moraxella sp.]|nr:LysR family transcriptional regulator [Moraxella sp.]
MSHNITLRQLKAFRAVAQTGSFTKAAESLHLTQSALSGLIKELESALDVRLFDRTTRQLSLSATGSHLYPMVSRILHDVETLSAEVGNLNDLQKGMVKVAVGQQIAANVMPSVMAKFAKDFPRVQISIEDCSVDKVLELVAAGEVDFGIGATRHADNNLQAELLLNQPFHLVLPPEHPLAKQSQIRWQSLHHEPLIVLNGSFSELLANDLSEAEARPIHNAAFHVNFVTTAFSMVSEGLGLTFCLPYSRNRVTQNGLEMRLLIEPRITRASYLYTRKNRELSPAAQKFYETLKEQLGQKDDEQDEY